MNRKNIIIFGFIAIAMLTVFISILFPKQKETIPQVISTNPENGAQEIMLTKQIEIQFMEENEALYKDFINVNITPQINFDSTWLTNTFKIIPKTRLNNNTPYKISVTYKNIDIYNFTFATQTFTPEEIEQYGPLQTQDDLHYGQELTKVVEKYPFYPNLPIKTSNFVVYYDFEKDQFAITFLNDNNDQTQKQEFINQAIERIKQIGGVEPIKYYTQP